MSEQKLLALLKRKRGFFEAILDLTAEESELSLHEWISNLEQKKVLLSCIEELDSEIKTFKAKFSHLPQEIDEELARIRVVVGNILKIDSNNYEKRRKEFGTQ